ncbi:MAG: FHA domain-containing protein [Kofleriaceae bacterium]|jgi:hypothetical protein|nr:FHA domain-containing protein [Kofleriaceae bacterium]MBP6838368.1 FHA domain-containing protein [Kofleriaceae bacterium]
MSTGVLIAVVVSSTLAGGLLLLLLLRKPKAPPRTCRSCHRVMLPTWDKCMFCGYKAVARLEFIHGPMQGQTVDLVEHVTTIGSVSGNTIVLADPGVSRKHAGIRRDEGAYELADFGSTNGVYVNGQRVPKKALAAGDVVRVGNTEAVFRPE